MSASPAAARADAPANILLVDDRPENLTALEAILEPLGENLVHAHSGEEALKRLLHDDFALILLDVRMPGLDGLAVAELIKGRERTRHVPIIFLTAFSGDEREAFRGYRAGAVDYVQKPFEPAVLQSKVGVFIELHRKNAQLAAQAEELRLREVEELRRASEERFRNLAEAMPQIVWTATPDGLKSYFNQRWYDYTGLDAAASRGSGWTSALHADDRNRTAAAWERSLADGTEFEAEYRVRRADGVYRWHLARALPTRDEDGGVVEWTGTSTDIDDQKRLEARNAFLVEASAVLGSSLDYRSTLASVASLAVPRIADWCAVDTLEHDELVRLATAHADPAKLEFARELGERYPPLRDAPHGAAQVVRSARAEFLAEIPDALFEEVAQDELHLRLLRELGLCSYICVPLVSRGRTLGAITLVLGRESGRRYRDDDLVLAEELALRAATAVDNALLYAAAEERARAARVLATIGDGVVMLDSDERTVLFNPAAEAISGLSADQVLGRSPGEFIPGWDEIKNLIPTASAPADGAAVRAETVPLEVGGRELWLSISGVAFDEGVVYAFRDLTEEHALEQLRADFVATVSHELRTPLAAIYGAAVTVRRTDIDLQDVVRDRLLQVVSQESERLARIVDDILLASHLDSGRLQHRIEPVDVVAVVREVVAAAQAHVPEGIAFAVDTPARVPPAAADAGQLRQVFVNLVDNAVKYSPDGGTVRVGVEVEPRTLRVSVSDEGLGIPAGERRRIFEKFYRLDPNMTRGIGGTGLGLYICRELMRRIDGRIWVDSRPGSGSVFTVEIPRAERGRGGGRRKEREAVQA